MVAGLVPPPAPARARRDALLVGLDDGDDAAVVRIDGGTAVVATADFFTPVVDDAYDWGRIAAANALSDVYAMGGSPVVAVNLLALAARRAARWSWPREVLRGGLDVAGAAGCHVGGGHSVDDPEPKYGMAVTGLADPDRLLRNDAGGPACPLTLTKPLGVGVLNSRHKATGEVFPQAVAAMTALNRRRRPRPRWPPGLRVRDRRDRVRPARPPAQAGPGQRRHGRGGRRRRARSSTAPGRPCAPGTSAAAPAATSTGCARTCDRGVDEDELLLLADAQTSGGLLVAGEVPGHPVIGELVPAVDGVTVSVR